MSQGNIVNKIIYFDKETIQNILQERNKGTLSNQIDISTTLQGSANIEMQTKINLGVPFWERLSFLFKGSLALSYIVKRNGTTTISSTEISEFEKLKPSLIKISNSQIRDIENPATFLRVAGGYLRIAKGGVEGVDTKEFKSVMDSYDGYDTYKLDNLRYVRFNNAAFVSNYKRNDLLTTNMTLYCISVGKFSKQKFDFLRQLKKMEKLISDVDNPKTLAEAFPNAIKHNSEESSEELDTENDEMQPRVQLFDVIYASIETGDNDE